MSGLYDAFYMYYAMRLLMWRVWPCDAFGRVIHFTIWLVSPSGAFDSVLHLTIYAAFDNVVRYICDVLTVNLMCLTMWLVWPCDTFDNMSVWQCGAFDRGLQLTISRFWQCGAFDHAMLLTVWCVRARVAFDSRKYLTIWRLWPGNVFDRQCGVLDAVTAAQNHVNVSA